MQVTKMLGSYANLRDFLNMLIASHKDGALTAGVLKHYAEAIRHHAADLVAQLAEAMAVARHLRDAFNPQEVAAAGRVIGLLECQEREVLA